VAVAEAASLTMALTSVVKLAAARQRPFVAHGNWPDPDRRHDPDDNLALWSGHTALSFAVAASAGTIASMRGRGEAPWVWATGLTAAAAVGWFRIGADEHHLTDVLAGAAVGTAIGIAAPRLLHRSREDPGGASVALVPLPLGIAGTF
jgi:membrane-associated phospholipid phosphatase